MSQRRNPPDKDPDPTSRSSLGLSSPDLLGHSPIKYYHFRTPAMNRCIPSA
jgi:hypothetical protein